MYLTIGKELSTTQKTKKDQKLKKSKRLKELKRKKKYCKVIILIKKNLVQHILSLSISLCVSAIKVSKGKMTHLGLKLVF